MLLLYDANDDDAPSERALPSLLAISHAHFWSPCAKPETKRKGKRNNKKMHKNSNSNNNDKTRHASACTFRFDVVSSIKETGWGVKNSPGFIVHSLASLSRSVSYSSFVIIHSRFPFPPLLSN